MVMYLAFHLFITPHPPGDYQDQRKRYARLYRVYMVLAYGAFAGLGLSFLRRPPVASWAPWFLIVAGVIGLVTAIVRRPRIADLPLWIHVIAFVLAVALL
jgi:hypothetical protein